MTDRILVIDDDKALCRSLQLQLRLKGAELITAHNGADGIKLVDEAAPKLVLLDVNLPDADGLEVLEQITARDSELPIVVITARQEMAVTITAMQKGAFDYIRKPFDLDDILLVLEKIHRRPVARKSPQGGDIDIPELGRHEIIGSHPAILEVLKQIGLLARGRVNTLITGESGTGKELAARAIHAASTPEAPFVAVNCSAVVPTLLESELFGHVKGAFTGADRNKTGKLEAAENGTIFFDEIGDMSLDLQAKLLRVLQEQEFEPVGGNRTIPLRARVVFATHRDLSAMVSENRFREDLFYRIAVSEVRMPPLRERKSDIPLLAEFFVRRLSREMHRESITLEEDALDRLMQYDWPGNVRELENVLARAVALARTVSIGGDDIAFMFGGQSESAPEAVTEIVPLTVVEKRHIAGVLEHTGWNITRTARLLEISPTTLRKKIADYAIIRPAD